MVALAGGRRRLERDARDGRNCPSGPVRGLCGCSLAPRLSDAEQLVHVPQDASCAAKRPRWLAPSASVAAFGTSQWILKPSLHHSSPMLLVIFGAGASYDSSPEVPGRRRSLPPPLAKDLVGRHFDPFTGERQMSRPIIALLRRAMNGNDPTSLETELARISEEAAGSAEIRRQLMAFRFYLHALIEHTVGDWLTYTQGFTYYLDLLNYIFAWQRTTKAPVRLVTFNYDVLLDTAVNNVLDHTLPASLSTPHAATSSCSSFTALLHGRASFRPTCLTGRPPSARRFRWLPTICSPTARSCSDQSRTRSRHGNASHRTKLTRWASRRWLFPWRAKLSSSALTNK